MVRYKMLAKDIDSSPIQYRTWVVDDQPDLTAALYAGLKSGTHSLADITAYAVLDDNAIVDFNLPDAENWQIVKKVLPSAISDSQLAVIGDFIYLFGGKGTGRIYRAVINNPTDWTDTGAQLPVSLYGSQLAIINDRVYLFGGNDGSLTDIILSAPINNPLDWVNHGSLLPKKISNSQLAIVNGFIYLFGGKEMTGASDAILIASTDDPLTWSDTYKKLAAPLYGSHIAIINNNIYLFGGLLFPDTPTDAIYSALIDDPTIWGLVNTLPSPLCFGQFIAIGDKGYLFASTESDSGVYFTNILRCDLASPTQWINLQKYLPGETIQSQIAIIYDRLFLFGGSGSSAIFAGDMILKYDFTNSTVIAYGEVTRTNYNNTSNKLDLFKVLGYPPWRTSFDA